MDYDSCGGTRLQIEPSGSLRGPNKGREKHGWKNNNNPCLLPLFMNSCRMCLSCLAAFHPHLHPSFVFCPLLSPVRKYTGNFYHNGTFSHIFCSLGIWTLTGGVLLRGADCILPHINKHFHKSGYWRALRWDRPGSRRACAVRLWNAYTEGLPLRFWWMDGHQAIGLRSGSDVWSAWYWGGWREAGKLFCIYESRFEHGWEVRGGLLVVWSVTVTGLRLQSATTLLSKSLSIP